MNPTTTGWVTFIGAIGMMCTLMSAEVASLHTWNEMAQPLFVAKAAAHLGVVIAAFVGGKLIPTDRDPAERTRATDNK